MCATATIGCMANPLNRPRMQRWLAALLLALVLVGTVVAALRSAGL